MKTAISIPDMIFRSADALAKKLGMSRSELYSNAVSEFLSRHAGRLVTERLDAVYSEEDSSLPTDVLALQTRTLTSEKW